MFDRCKYISLFSASPRRKELLARLQVPFIVRPAGADEKLPEYSLLSEAVEIIALRKLYAGMEICPAGWGLAADTLVEIDGIPLGKPANRQEACAMLKRLSGRKHHVYSAFGISSPYKIEIHSECCDTEVFLRKLSDTEIEHYLNTGEWQGAAGAYRIQERGELLVERINGLWSTVVGLPLGPVYGMLSQMAYF